MNFDTMYEEYPILYCMELCGNKNFSVYSIEDDHIYELESRNHEFMGKSHSMEYLNGEFMAMDTHGYLYQIAPYVPV